MLFQNQFFSAVSKKNHAPLVSLKMYIVLEKAVSWEVNKVSELW